MFASECQISEGWKPLWKAFEEGSGSSCLVTDCLKFEFLNPTKGIQWPVKEMPT